MNNQSPKSKHQINSNHQIPITKRIWFGKLGIGVWLLFGYWLLVFGVFQAAYAADCSFSVLKEASQRYYPEHKYNEFISYIDSLGKDDPACKGVLDYYCALTRWRQLKYLEESQQWNEYFSQGDQYRRQYEEYATSAINVSSPKDPANLYSRLLLWQGQKDRQIAGKEGMLPALMAAIEEYSRSAADAAPLKDIADQLSGYGEKANAGKLYRLYVEKLSASTASNADLSKAAEEFYRQGNVELSAALYDAYLERIKKNLTPEKMLATLIEIARKFSFKDEGRSSPAYAEKIFQQVEQLGGKDVFDCDLLYLRAYNLQRSKDYKPALKFYLELAERFPDCPYADKALFKAGAIYTYIYRDAPNGKAIFGKLTQKQNSPQKISALYQLGLLSQYEGNNQQAETYYDKLVSQAGQNYPQSLNLVQDRLDEIESGNPLEYNLKTMLDAALKPEYAGLDTARVGINASAYNPVQGKEISISSEIQMPESGSMSVDIKYLWAGDLGENAPSSSQPSFNTRYNQPGTKIIGVVTMTPSGALDRGFEMVDVE